MSTRPSAGAGLLRVSVGRVARVLFVGSFASFASVGCGDTPLDLFPSPADDASADAPNGDELATVEASAQSPDQGGRTSTCLSDSECTSREATRCEPALHLCVECIGMGDCHATRSTCNRVTNRCVVPCTTDHDCDPRDVCDRIQGGCVECIEDSQCAKPENKCVQEVCVECASAQDCPTGKRCWQATCVACVTGADCPDGGTCSIEHVCT